jgi:hypothetical protein
MLEKPPAMLWKTYLVRCRSTVMCCAMHEFHYRDTALSHYPSISIVSGSSINSFTRTKNCTASRPSTSR